jgi:hypothetical protein
MVNDDFLVNLKSKIDIISIDYTPKSYFYNFTAESIFLSNLAL